jgi:hypothetical protein
MQAIYPAADWLAGLQANPLWRAGAHANLRKAGWLAFINPHVKRLARWASRRA